MDPDLATLHALRHALAHARAALLALDSGQHDQARALLKRAEHAPELATRDDQHDPERPLDGHRAAGRP